VGSNGPEGMAVLEEIGGLLGSLVWGTLRSVRAWVDTPVEDRPGMFPEDAARRRMAEVLEASPPDNIEGALTDLAQLLEQPADADPAAVGVVCTRIARWADDRAYTHTAAQFYQVAANACLTNGEYALAAAQAARDLADYSRAELWLQRAVGLSRQEGAWETYAKAFLAYGTMMRRRGNMPAARKHVERALRRAIRCGSGFLQGAAFHDLFVIESGAGNAEKAKGFAHEAIAAYPQGEPLLRMLANDLGYMWLQEGKVFQALAVFRKTAALCDERTRHYALGGMALAAGRAGSLTDFTSARAQLSRSCVGPGVAEAWAEVAEGALILGDLNAADSAARIAERIATERREHRIEFLVSNIRDRIVRARLINETSEDSPISTSGTIASPAEGPLESLASELLTALQPA
jgi:tetratricopeptide (TPR) repeat protein